jgi:polar amino acid transport system substrate-binding protein
MTRKRLLMLSILFFIFVEAAFSKEKFVIPIATENYPPYEMEKAVKGLRGFDFEVATAAFELLGYEVDIEFLPWKRALAYARLGKVAGILTCAYTKERAEFMAFSDPISVFINGFYARKGHNETAPALIEDVVGRRVSSVEAYESYRALVDIGANPIPAPNTASAIQMLQNDRFDYLYLAKQSTDFMLKQIGATYDFEFYPIVKKDFFFCFSKQYDGYEVLVDEFNKALFILKKNGTYETIHNKYR